MPELSSPAGWYGTVDDFLQGPASAIRDELRKFVSALVLPVGDPQLLIVSQRVVYEQESKN
jgi:hypothetical protein